MTQEHISKHLDC